MDATVSALAHRGPDSQRVLVQSPVAMGFRRLSILDLSPAGDQPMTIDHGELAMVFNGEIYNYIELRAELQALGHHFRSTGDSEVLLTAYRQWGEACLDHLTGMFAFCIADHRRSRLFLARDRFGIKPLYFHRSERGLLFASEIKAIRKSGLWHGDINLARFSTFLCHGRTEGVLEDEDTYLTGIHQILPGHSAIVQFDGRMTQQSYWSTQAVEADCHDNCTELFLEAFDESIRIHMRSDVPVGVMLSGGMDSVSIACTMAKMIRSTGGALGRLQALHSYTFVADDVDESEQLRDVLSATGAIPHTMTQMNAECFWSRLHKLVWFHDEPVHSPSVLAGFDLYQMAASHGLRVMMSGHGADETLGGYPENFENMLVSEALSGRLPTLLQEARNVASFTGQPLRPLLFRVVRMLRGHVLSGSSRFRTMQARRRLLEAPGQRFLQPDFAARATPGEVAEGGGGLRAALRRATYQSPLPHYLRAEDRNSMAHGIEARVPFLDHNLVQLAMRLPPRQLMSDGWNKRILRESMENRIPDSVRLRRAKLGFPTSSRQWFAGVLAPGFRELLADGAIMQQGWFDRAAVQAAFKAHQQGHHNATNLLFNIAQLESWLRWHRNDWE